MTFLDFFRRILGQQVVCVQQPVLDDLQYLADQEQRHPEELAADLISMALDRLKISDYKLERWERLTPREQEVAALVCLRYTNPQIAARLSISTSTASTHVRNILNKLDLRSKVELQHYLSEFDFSSWG